MADDVKLLEGILGGWREPVPKRFWQTFQDKPFTKCSLCFQSLHETGKRYIVNKYYLNGELRQEMAMCFDCRQKLRDGYSKESQEAAKGIYARDMIQKRVRWVADLEPDEQRPEQMTNACLLCGVGKQSANEFVEYANCEGKEIVFYVHPFMICVNCAIDLNDALSVETREVRRQFIEEHFGIPPLGPAGKKQEQQNELLLM